MTATDQFFSFRAPRRFRMEQSSMARIQDKDTRYFIEIDLRSLKIIRCSYRQRQLLDKGRQSDPNIHRLFLTKGQYDKFVTRCAPALGSVLDR